jgi:hypothetical protein
MSEQGSRGAGPSVARKPAIVRLRAGFLVLLALLIVSGMAGRWTATLFSLGLGWAALIGLAVAVVIGAVLSRLSLRIYLGLAAIVCAVAMYTAFDFARGPVDWSDGWAGGLALLVGLLLGAAFWDFWRLTHEVRAWAHEQE